METFLEFLMDWFAFDLQNNEWLIVPMWHKALIKMYKQ